MTADETIRSVEATCFLIVEVDRVSGVMKVYIIPGLGEQVFLGMDFVHTFGIIHDDSKREWFMSDYPDIVHRYADECNEAGNLDRTSDLAEREVVDGLM